jgi:hypothetical protein
VPPPRPKENLARSSAVRFAVSQRGGTGHRIAPWPTCSRVLCSTRATSCFACSGPGSTPRACSTNNSIRATSSCSNKKSRHTALSGKQPKAPRKARRNARIASWLTISPESAARATEAKTRLRCCTAQTSCAFGTLAGISGRHVFGSERPILSRMRTRMVPAGTCGAARRSSRTRMPRSLRTCSRTVSSSLVVLRMPSSLGQEGRK